MGVSGFGWRQIGVGGGHEAGAIFLGKRACLYVCTVLACDAARKHAFFGYEEQRGVGDFIL
jgi:hypothetical protein